MSNETKKDYLGLGIFTGWTLNLIILKYYGLIATTWLWVFAPIWLPLLITAGFVFILWLVVALSTLVRNL